MRYFSVRVLVYNHLPKSKLSLRKAPQAIIYQFATIPHTRTILVFCPVQTKCFFKNWWEPDNNLRSTILEKEHYTDTIVPTREALVIRSLLEFYLCFIVATLFLLNGHSCYFAIFKCMGTTVHDNATVQFIFFLSMRLNMAIVTSYDLLTVTLASCFFIIKDWHFTTCGSISQTD